MTNASPNRGAILFVSSFRTCSVLPPSHHSTGAVVQSIPNCFPTAPASLSPGYFSDDGIDMLFVSRHIPATVGVSVAWLICIGIVRGSQGRGTRPSKVGAQGHLGQGHKAARFVGAQGHLGQGHKAARFVCVALGPRLLGRARLTLSFSVPWFVRAARGPQSQCDKELFRRKRSIKSWFGHLDRRDCVVRELVAHGRIGRLSDTSYFELIISR